MINQEMVDKLWEVGQQTGVPLTFSIFDKRVLMRVSAFGRFYAGFDDFIGHLDWQIRNRSVPLFSYEGGPKIRGNSDWQK